MLALPLDSTLDRTDSKGPSHRLSVSTASAAGGSRSSSWSTRDDETLIQARAQGLNWNQIGPKHFPNKTPNACRKRHERLMERQNAEQWDGVKLDVLAQAYMEVRRDMWSILAARVGEKWQLVETKCMEKGLKNLTQAYRSAQKKLENGTYHDHDDSGVGVSDLEEEQEDHHVDMSSMSSMPAIPEAHYTTYPSYPTHSHQPRVPSIQSMLHPMQHPHPMQQSLQQQPMQQSMQQQPLQQQSMQQSLQQQSMQQPLQQQSMQQPLQQQSMQQPMHQQAMQYPPHHLPHQQ
ncbi:Myb-DNA-bind-6 multi-domain protein [Pyrenophora tritici-repentis]|nr:Myb-DNA-bind-6 multi-domain protein [Pyrenophora tritici-repentis]PWO22587.1 ChaA, Ca2+H+ antiporter [Pyrenophora tritici-repentis]PZC94063.1 PAT1 multi-domain protein [Pyrenophora tritici-repentis]PZD23512.1 PAT1 multi-domain protein [Pyrenophora tritici-repentis]